MISDIDESFQNLLFHNTFLLLMKTFVCTCFLSGMLDANKNGTENFDQIKSMPIDLL